MAYRHPLIALTTVFLPLWVLSFVVLMIFFQNNFFTDRIINTATILIAFTAYFHVIRATLPQNINITLIEMVVYAVIGTCLLGLIRAFTIRDETVNVWREVPGEDPFFIISATIIGFSMVLVVGGYLAHRCYFERKYEPNLKIRSEVSRIIFRDWLNQSVVKKIVRNKQRL